MLGLIISIIVIGLIAGALARLVVPGKQDMSIVMTIVLGIVGSFVGGFLGYLLFHKRCLQRLFPTRRDHRLFHRRRHRLGDLPCDPPAQRSERLSALDGALRWDTQESLGVAGVRQADRSVEALAGQESLHRCRQDLSREPVRLGVVGRCWG